MKVLGLDDKWYAWNPVGANIVKRENSSYHENARDIIRLVYPSEPLLEEVSLPGTKPTLYTDYLIPRRKIIIEVHGEQHYNWTPHFHSTKRDFLIAKKNDKNKKYWCKINNFYFVELPYFEDLNDWRHRIENASLESSGGEENEA